MKEEFKRIKNISKEIIGKEHYKKIKKLKTYADKTEGLKYLASSKLHLTLTELESKIKEVEEEKSRLLDLKIKLLLSKVRIFKTTFNKRDYEVIKKLIKEIEGEIKC